MKTKLSETHDSMRLTLTGSDGKAVISVTRSRIKVSLDAGTPYAQQLANKIAAAVQPRAAETYGDSFKRIIAAAEPCVTLTDLSNAI